MAWCLTERLFTNESVKMNVCLENTSRETPGRFYSNLSWNSPKRNNRAESHRTVQPDDKMLCLLMLASCSRGLLADRKCLWSVVLLLLLFFEDSIICMSGWTTSSQVSLRSFVRVESVLLNEKQSLVLVFKCIMSCVHTTSTTSRNQ